MTLQDLGALGELVGGLAVIVTLVYLAIQIRQFTLGVSSATFHSSMQGFNQLNATLGASPALSRIYDLGLQEPESLAPDEQLQFVWFIRSYVNIYENLYQQYVRGGCPEAYWVRYARELKQTLETPGGRLFRTSNTTYVELYAYVESMPANEQPAWDFALPSGP